MEGSEDSCGARVRHVEVATDVRVRIVRAAFLVDVHAALCIRWSVGGGVGVDRHIFVTGHHPEV